VRPRAKVTIDSLEVAYEKSIGTKMNDLDLCLEVAVALRTCQPLRHIRHWISWKPLEIQAWFQRTRKWPIRGMKWSS